MKNYSSFASRKSHFVHVTYHAFQRGKERLRLGREGMIRLARDAWRDGRTFYECTGYLQTQLCDIAGRHNAWDTVVKAYRNVCFIFSSNRELITVYPLGYSSVYSSYEYGGLDCAGDHIFVIGTVLLEKVRIGQELPDYIFYFAVKWLYQKRKGDKNMIFCEEFDPSEYERELDDDTGPDDLESTWDYYYGDDECMDDYTPF